MNRAIYALSTLAVCMTLSAMIPASYAFYTIETYGDQYGDINKSSGSFASLEEQLELAERAKAAADANPATGSGTPYMDADGVVGASIIAGAIFGGIATTLFVKGRSGRYAAYGRG
tara:strand:- start:113 stop:460 length:348 start_codon:yes stop_codon:yes gene_type:complete